MIASLCNTEQVIGLESLILGVSESEGQFCDSLLSPVQRLLCCVVE